MVAHALGNKERTEDIAIEDGVTFSTMLLPNFILNGLNSAGFKKPSPIQLAAIPLARCGLDLIVQAKSGTGKTLVFAITALESISLNIHRVQVIILAPTREIALQIADVIKCIGSCLKGLKVGTFVGGRSTNSDKPVMKGCHIAVGSPGRIRHLIELNILDSKAVRLFVLDEADKLFEKEYDYQHDLNFIFNNCGESKQVLALSATYPPELLEFTKKYMRDGQHVTPSGGPTPVLLGLKQMVLISRDHPDFTARLSIKEKDLINILETVSFDQCCVFLNYATRAESINNLLKKKGFASICLTGKQDMDTRIEAITTFKSGGCRILVTTDLAARGIDASCINLVINLDLPWDAATYLHRMGRAGRYGSHGICISIISEGIELEKFRKLLGMIGGKSMHVNVIPRMRKVDLWTEDINDLDKIQGIIGSSSEEDTLEEKLKKNFQTANECLQGRDKESIYLYEKDKVNGVSTSVAVNSEMTQPISLKELEDELRNYLVETVQQKQQKEVLQKVSTPRKSTPKKVPTYSEILTNSRGRNSPAKKSLSGSISGKFIANAVNKFEKVVENKEKIVSDSVSKITEEVVPGGAKKPNECNLSNCVNAPVINPTINFTPECNDSDMGCKGSSPEVGNEPLKIDVASNLPSNSDTSKQITDDSCTKRKRSISSSGSDEFDSYTYTIDSNDDYETIGDVTSISGIDLNSNPDDFESLSDISSAEEESEVDYPSEIFHVLECDYEEPQQSPPTDWFAVISKEIQNYVLYSRQYMNANPSYPVSSLS
ncbi:probable ATP-dependent RNA helicase DDX20 [Halyomorpha halys]|uniref:probable ATP-dependent RNA helicase DDX20 n=1 Tax=Halyomorpha halys TaxID=286706 RepID=UPI0006D4E6B5|nr:probable ATP-dependent RNA helicase DDX20 [Halyomorpha halys]